MPLQTNAINAAILLSSFFLGSKIIEFKIISEQNEKHYRDLNKLTESSRLRWTSNLKKLEIEVKNMKEEFERQANSEAKRIEQGLISEKSRLKNEYDSKITEQMKIMEEELIKFKNEVNHDIIRTQKSLVTAQAQLDEFRESKIELKKLEDLGKKIIEDESFGSLDKSFSMRVLHNELIGLLPILRQYFLITTSNFSIFNYYFSKAFSELLFVDSPFMKSDILAELKSSFEKNDLNRALFIFNKLEGWPRLILKDWAEKCRKRLEYIDEIKYKLYLNK